MNTIGLDLVNVIVDMLDHAHALESGVVHLHIPISDPSGAWAVTQLEPLGFSYAAWFPEYFSEGDSIRLQPVTDHAIDDEVLAIASPEGKEVKSFVIDEWQGVRHLPITD